MAISCFTLKKKSNDSLKKIIQIVPHLSIVTAVSCFTYKKKLWWFNRKSFQTMLQLSHVNEGPHNELN